MASGVYSALKKDHTEYYRASLTYKNKHISLGSFDEPDEASAVYQESLSILKDQSHHNINTDTGSTNYDSCVSKISFEKYVILINLRNNGIYFKTPIYLCKNYFLYFLSTDNVLIFDADDLFYYAKHRICCRGGYYYVNEYGMQTNILSRYGIRSHSVTGRDYIFKNGNHHDYRYHNIQVINQYYGVRFSVKEGRNIYTTKIHVNGDYIVGSYYSEIEAAIAYNKAADLLEPLTDISYSRNYIEDLSSIEYASYYNKIILKKNFRNYLTLLSSDPAALNSSPANT